MVSQRNNLIDAYRALFIGGVLVYHYLNCWAPPFASRNIYGYDHSFNVIWSLGRYGPLLFFVISGLVISMTVTRSRDALEFGFRRFSRLYPAYLVATVFTFGLTSLAHISELKVGLRDFLLTLTIAAPMLGGRFVDGAYWSLLVELKFYILIGVSFLFLKKKFWVAPLIVGLICYPLERISPHLASIFFIPPYLPMFLIGIGLWYSAFDVRRLVSLAMFLVGFLLIWLHQGIPGEHLHPGWLPTAFVLAVLATMVGLVSFQPRLPLGPLPWLGRISYSLYLVHENMGVILINIMKHLGAPDLLAFLATIAVATCLAALMFKYVELPAQAALRKGWDQILSRGREAETPHALPTPEKA